MKLDQLCTESGPVRNPLVGDLEMLKAALPWPERDKYHQQSKWGSQNHIMDLEVLEDDIQKFKSLLITLRKRHPDLEDKIIELARSRDSLWKSPKATPELEWARKEWDTSVREELDSLRRLEEKVLTKAIPNALKEITANAMNGRFDVYLTNFDPMLQYVRSLCDLSGID